MAAREIHPVQFATRVIGPGGAEMTTYTNDNPYRAEADADPKASPVPESAESSQPEAREINPVQGMNNAPVSDLPPIVKVRAGTDPDATYGPANLPKGVEIDGAPDTALEKRAVDPTDEAVQPIPIEKVETALSVEEQTVAALSPEEIAKRKRQANLEKARAAKAAKNSQSEKPAESASAEKAAEEEGLVF